MGGVLSTSQAANNFMGTGLLLVPDDFSVFRSIIHKKNYFYFISEEKFLMRPTINNNNRRVIDVVVVVEIEEK